MQIPPSEWLFLTLRDSGTLERTHKSEDRLRSQFMWIGPLRMRELSRKVRKSLSILGFTPHHLASTLSCRRILVLLA